MRAPDHGGRAGAREGEVTDDGGEQQDLAARLSRATRHPGDRIVARSNERKLTVNRAHGD